MIQRASKTGGAAVQVALLLIAGGAPNNPGCQAQSMAGVYDFGLGRHGEKRGDWTPGEWLAAVLLIMTICAGLAVSVGLCYYVSKRETRVTGSVAGGRSLDSSSLGLASSRGRNLAPDYPSSDASILVAQI